MAVSPIDFVVGAAVNDCEVLRNNLAASSMIANGLVALEIEKDAPSASIALNRILERTRSPFVIFAHQDVYIPSSWLQRLMSAIQHLDDREMPWAVLGLVGKTSSNEFVGRVWSTGLGRELGASMSVPIPVVSVDELLFVVRRADGLKFDEGLPGFHLYGTDIVQEALALGRGAFVFDGPVVHNSRGVVLLRRDYWRSYFHLRRKWRRSLPIHTCCASITTTAFAFFTEWLTFMRRRAAGQRPRSDRLADPRAQSRALGYEGTGGGQP